MAKMVLGSSNLVVGKGGHQDCYEHVPHQLLCVQGHWQMQHLPVQVHGEGQDGSRELKLGLWGKVAIRTAMDMSPTFFLTVSSNTAGI